MVWPGQPDFAGIKVGNANQERPWKLAICHLISPALLSVLHSAKTR